MSRQFWAESLFWAVADGTAIANTTTETKIFNNVVVPANYMADGRVLRIYAAGVLSTTATPTTTFTLRWGGESGTVLAITEAITNGSGVTNANWSLLAYIQTRANGASGSLIVAGQVFVNTSATAVVSHTFGASGFDAMAAVTVDLTADTQLALTADWSAASASNTLTGKVYVGESLN